MNPYEIFKQIESTPGKNDKIQIIKDNADNEEFVEYLKFLYDDMITTGLSSKKINKEFNLDDFNYVDVFFDDALEVMEYLEKNNTGTDKVIMEVQCFLGSIEWIEYQNWLKQVFTKSYKCGITASSVNKAIPGIIHEFKCQLAHSYEKYADRIKSNFYLSLKLDGHRTLAFINFKNNKVLDVKFRTRKGHEVTGLNEIKDEIIKGFNLVDFTNAENIVLDGEITVLDDTTDPESVFQSTSKIIRKDGNKTGLKFQVFDYVLESEFWNGKSDLMYLERRGIIERMFGQIFNDAKYVVKVPILYSGDDISKIAELSDKVTELGYEGIMLNTAHGLYETKRTPHLLKVKKFHSCDGIIKDVYEGSAKYTGKLGGIVITFEDQVVNIGSGFTDHERELYWNNPELIVGKIGEYQYFERTENQNGGTDLRFATWKGLRLDKDEGDLNYE